MRAENEVVLLKKTEGDGLLARFQPENLEQAMKVADVLSKSGLLPDHLRGKPADILATMLAGSELGLSMMASFRAIYLVKGKVGFYSDFIAARAMQHPECIRFQLVEEESSDVKATYVAERRHQGPTKFSYTIEQAQRAGLMSNSNYKAHPAAMLRARCASALAKIVFPETMFGIYSRDEVEEIEREINPAPPAARPTVEAAPQVPGRTSRAVRVAASMKPPAVIDVKPGETEEQATEREAMPRMHAKLSDAELSAALDDARVRLENSPAGTPLHKGLKTRLESLERELVARTSGKEASL